MSETGIEPFNTSSIARFKTGPVTEDVHYHVFYDSVPDEYRLVAEQVLGETATNKEKGLRKLRRFMEKEELSATEDILIMVLRACKYNLQKSETKLKRFLRYRRSIAQGLSRMDQKKIELIIEDTIFSVLPYRDKFGRTVLVTKYPVSFDKYSLEDIELVAMCFILYLLNFPMTSICGLSYIAENKYESAYVMYCIVKNFKSFVDFLLTSPVRKGRVDILHENVLVRLFCNALRPILPIKLTQNIFFNGSSYKNLHAAYPLAILPKEFDGNMESINCKIYKENLMKFIQKMREEGQKSGNSAN